MGSNKSKNSNDTVLTDRNVMLFILIFFTGLFMISIILPQIFIDLNDKTITASVRSAEEAAPDTTYESTDYTEMMSNVVPLSPENAEAKENTSAAKALVVFPLDINSATADELMAIRGIGEVTAGNIVEYRDLNGYFYSLDELLNVDGIGSKKLEELKGYIYIDTALFPETSFVHTEPTEYSETVATTVVTVETEEYTETASAFLSGSDDDGFIDDFIIATEEFITEPDEEDFENYEVFDFEKWYLENVSKNKITELETEYCPDFPLELNSASAEDLTYIKGIGAATAERIVTYARTVGFNSVDDLLNVNGIGAAKLESIRPYVYVIPCGAVSVSDTTISDTETESITATVPETETTAETSREIYSVNVNICGKEELMRLPGLNDKLADDILELRELIGPFKNKDELELAIPAEKLLEIWDHISV